MAALTQLPPHSPLQDPEVRWCAAQAVCLLLGMVSI